MNKSTSQGTLRDLGDGLVLRRANPTDVEELSEFNGKLHGDNEPDARRVAAWTRDLFEKPHPTYEVGDFTIVEDTRSGKIVSSMNLISQTWSYGGIEFGVGRPELVGTHADYRNRGLVRAQFEAVHQWSAERGEPLQAITGIPYYYRLFGYEMAVNLDGGRAGYTVHVPRLKEDEKESYAIRPALLADIPFMMELYELGSNRSLLACRRDAAVWQYEVGGKSAENVNRCVLFIVEDLAGQPLAFFGTPPFTWGDMLPAQIYEVKPGVSWNAVTPAVIRFLEKRHAELSALQEHPKLFGSFGFWLGEDHPVYHVIPHRLPFTRKPYAWYLRVPDLPAFIRKIAPVLESRLEASYIPGYTGETRLTFYNGGLRLAFENGKLSAAEQYQPTPVGHEGDAAFPELTFLQLLFGYRSLDELRTAFPDCWTWKDDAYVLLNTLFPRQPSQIWPVS
ncbi:MAG: hypothetical protein A2Z49_09805 [Chloroflexi bacterium RBG_19FT_COMBO_56_12]|nr:MAG: hypothetical protein A2Z49_09805 [Chloroflexi bacterium RBG_19FT_COMBO_56_12]